MYNNQLYSFYKTFSEWRKGLLRRWWSRALGPISLFQRKGKRM